MSYNTYDLSDMRKWFDSEPTEDYCSEEYNISMASPEVTYRARNSSSVFDYENAIVVEFSSCKKGGCMHYLSIYRDSTYVSLTNKIDDNFVLEYDFFVNGCTEEEYFQYCCCINDSRLLTQQNIQDILYISKRLKSQYDEE